MQISRYVKTIPYEDKICLFHTVNNAIVNVPSVCIENGKISDQLDENSIKALTEMEYLNVTDRNIQERIQSYYINSKKLFISLELNLTCNLKCPYCYQNGNKSNKIIEDKYLDELVVYVEKVYKESPFQELYFKTLGGEPTLVWKKYMYIYKKLSGYCKENGIRFHVMLDTNGMKIEDILKLCGYDSLLLTIPLSCKECHDKYRKRGNGEGTYDTIINNITILQERKSDVKVVIRHNTDEENIDKFGDFIKDLSRKLPRKAWVSVNYTVEYNGEYKNQVSYEKYIDWISDEAISILAEYNMPISISPYISIEECQFRSRYSLKVFSDGTVGSCAMSFFDKDRTNLCDLNNEFPLGAFFEKKRMQSLSAENDCLDCNNFFICGGTNKLPCVMGIDEKMCEKKIFSVNIEKFICKYLELSKAGKGDLFIVFRDGELYR